MTIPSAFPAATASIERTFAELQANLASLPGRQARLNWLVAEAERTPRLAAAERNADNLVPGCLSPLWLVAHYQEGACRFEADSDSRIVRAFATLVCRLFNGHDAPSILACPPLTLDSLGLELATSNRRNALSRLEAAIRDHARRFAAAPPSA